MDRGILVAPDVEAGKQLVRALDASDLEVKAAFWFYREEAEKWRLYIATNLVKVLGPREVYSKVLQVLKENRISALDLSDISVVDPSYSLVTMLNLAFRTEPKDIKDISVAADAVNGVYVRAAHIYRMSVR